MRGGRHVWHCSGGAGDARITAPLLLLLLAACLLCVGSVASHPDVTAASTASGIPDISRVLAPAAVLGGRTGVHRRLLQMSAAAATAATTAVGGSASANSTVVAEARKGAIHRSLSPVLEYVWQVENEHGDRSRSGKGP